MTMNARPEPSDARFVEMLQQRAGHGAPRDLVAAISTLVNETPQSPRQLRTRLASSGRGRTGLILVAAIMVVTALGAAIAGGTKLTTPDPRRNNETVESPPPPSAPTPPPTSSSTAPGVARAFGMEPQVVPYLFSDAVGWVATGTALYRTTDGGRTWADRTPPHVGATFGSLVVDADTAFVNWAEGGNSVSIASTRDAGATWTTTLVDRGALGPLVSFGSATSGTLTFFDTIDTVPARVHVYLTSDGGRTWDGPTAGAFPASEIKPGGWGGGAIWLNVGKADRVPFDDRLWLSTDGGVTWKARRFPTADVVPAGELKWVAGPPLVLGGGQIVMVVSGGDSEGLFRSDDDGQSWQLLKSWTLRTSDFEPLRLSSGTWVLASGDGTLVLSTADAGGHWRSITGDRPIFYLSSPTFASPDHGWAVHVCNRRNRIGFYRGPDSYCDGNTLLSVLLETTDGGKTWHRLDSNGG